LVIGGVSVVLVGLVASGVTGTGFIDPVVNSVKCTVMNAVGDPC
jgi:hypothetical protein